MNLNENNTLRTTKFISTIVFFLLISLSSLNAQDNSPDRWKKVERWVGTLTYEYKGTDAPIVGMAGNHTEIISYNVLLVRKNDRYWTGKAEGHGSMEAYAEQIIPGNEHIYSAQGQGDLQDSVYLSINYRHGHYTIGNKRRVGPIDVHFRHKWTILGQPMIKEIDETKEMNLKSFKTEGLFSDSPQLPESGLVLSGTIEYNWHWDSHKVTWWLKPADERPHPCDDTDIREGIVSPEAEMLRESIAAALKAQGAKIGPEHVVVLASEGQHTSQGFDMLRYTVPLQSTDNQPRHNWNCLVEKIELGEIEPGTLIGAGEMIFGMVQQAGGKTRLTMRRTEVETSIVIEAGMSTVDGTGHEAVSQAASEAAEAALSGLQFY